MRKHRSYYMASSSRARGSASASARGSVSASARGSASASARGSASASPRASTSASPKASTSASPKASTGASPKASTGASPKASSSRTSGRASTSDTSASGPKNENNGIREVWAHNLEDEFKLIRPLVEKYYYVAMDTEFPGVVCRPIRQGDAGDGPEYDIPDFEFQKLRCNVNVLRIIQLGMTLFDENGKTPGDSFNAWQFNFKIDLDVNVHAKDSIFMLKHAGIDFDKHKNEGIDPVDFAELLMSSGIVLMDNIKFVGFHAAFDFGFLLKMLMNTSLPDNLKEFTEMLELYFPKIYDIKYIMRSCKNLKGGLQTVAENLGLKREGHAHQAGSDALLTGMVFFKIREKFFHGKMDDSKYLGHPYGLKPQESK